MAEKKSEPFFLREDMAGSYYAGADAAMNAVALLLAEFAFRQGGTEMVDKVMAEAAHDFTGDNPDHEGYAAYKRGGLEAVDRMKHIAHGRLAYLKEFGSD